MPFALGVAIANLFQRIANLLDSGGLPSISPIPGGGSSTGGGGTGGGGTQPQPQPQPQPIPPLPPPIGPPPIVTVPVAGGEFPTSTPQPDCPPLSEVDMRALEDLPNLLPPALLPQTSPLILFPAQDEVMPLAQGSGTIVESVDFFRFRAISTNDSVPVSFFGRMQLLDGRLVPFSRTLTTSTANTIFETTMQTGPGFLLGAAASVPVGSITTGAVNAIGEIGRMAGGVFTPHTVLFSGQVDDQQPLSSNLAIPTTPVVRPTYYNDSDNTGTTTSLGLTVTPSTGRRVRIIAVAATYQCSAAAFVRQVSLTFEQTAGFFMRMPGARTFAANQIAQVRAYVGGQSNAVASTTTGLGILTGIPLPESLYFYDAVDVKAQFFTNAVDDVVEAIFVYWEES